MLLVFQANHLNTANFALEINSWVKRLSAVSRIIISLFFCLSLINCLGQEADSVQTVVAKKPHSPRKATIMSAIVPGAGQIYNKKWWKVPIIYGGFAGLGYLVVTNSNDYNTYKDAYIQRVDGDSATVDVFDGIYTEANLLELQSYYKRNRDLAAIGVVLLYALNVIDANVDAHLFNFDVGEDLTMSVEPKAIMRGYNKPPGIGLGFSLRLK